MFIAEEPPLVSCNSQRSDRPSRQARSIAVSGASENDVTAMPWISLASISASRNAATTASRIKVCVVCPGSGRRVYCDWPAAMMVALVNIVLPVRSAILWSVNLDGKAPRTGKPIRRDHMLRAAIIGLGRWGRSLVSSVEDNPDVRFVIGHTRTRSSAEEFCRDNGVRLVDDFDAVLSDSAVDAVVLATPHSQHAQQIKRAAEAGKHILVEKPITLDLASARSAVAAAHQAGVVLAVGFCRRFHPSVGELRQRLCDGRLGKVVGMVAQHTTSTQSFIPADNWRDDPDEAPAGAMTAVGLHALDLMIEFG